MWVITIHYNPQVYIIVTVGGVVQEVRGWCVGAGVKLVGILNLDFIHYVLMEFDVIVH